MSTTTTRPGTTGADRPRLVGGQPVPGPFVRALKGLVLLVLCGIVVVPFVGIVSTSIAPQEQITDSGGFVLLPSGISWDAYRSVLNGGVVSRALVVSIGITAVGTALSLTATALLAYALSRPFLTGGRTMLFLVLGALLFSPGMIPTYLAVRQFQLIDTLAALVLPTAISAFNVVVMRAFFSSIPGELIDAARMDGAGEWQVFRNIALPLSRAVLAVIGLFYAVGYWNSFFSALLYLNDTEKWPLQMVLRTYVVNDTTLSNAELGSAAEALPAQPSIQMAILVLSIVPIVIVYPFLQRHLTKGVLTGAVKG